MEALRPLANQPGVELVMLLSQDGVPIAVVTRPDGDEADPKDEEPAAALGALSKDDALAAITAGWLNDLRLAVGPLSWDEPERIIMRCARGALVMRRMRGAVLMVRVQRGLSPEDVRLPMEGVVARIERSLSGMGRTPASPSDQSNTQPPGLVPSENPTDRGKSPAQPSRTGNREDLSGN